MFTYVGEIEEVRYSTVLGWAVDAMRPDEPVKVALAVNGKSVAETMTNRDHRFEMVAPMHVMSSTAVEVLLYDEEGAPVQSLVWGESAKRLPPEWKSGSRMALPSFFVVGAAKSGTTSLHVYLDQHPDIFMSKPKEPFFFEAEYDRGPEYYYRRYFGGWNGEREVGESRHRNLYLPYIPARIHSFNPEARIIAILRNPAERAISHWRHRLRGGFDRHARGKETLGLFDALQADLERIRSGATVSTPEEIARYATNAGDDEQDDHRTYLDTGYYLEQLKRYEALFGRSKMHVVLADDLFQDPAKTMMGIFSFLQVDPSIAAQIKYDVFNDAPVGKDQQVTPEVWQWLVDHYKPYNQALEEYLGRPLDMWDRPSAVAAPSPAPVALAPTPSPAAMYVDLLKKSILEDLYTENEVRLIYLQECLEGKKTFQQDIFLDIRRRCPDVYDEYVRLREFGLAYNRPMQHLGFPHTMLNRRRVENIEFCLDTILKENVPGDCMECGVWRGGSVIFMRGYLAAHGVTDRTVWVADSFEGIPAPSLPQDGGLHLSKETHPMLAIDLETVRNLFERYGLLDEQVRFLKGWFKDTLPQAPVERLALLRLDGDLYESTMDALEALYDKVVPGGFVIIDDYGCLEPCRRAVTEFRERHAIADPIHEVDWTAVYWRRGSKEQTMSPILEEVESPLLNATHADVAQPWSGLAEITLDVRPNPGLGPVMLEVAVENGGMIVGKEIADAGVSQVRFGIQTDLLPDGPAVLLFTAKQGKFIWESGLAFKVSNTSQANKSDVLWRQYGESASLESETQFPAQPFGLPLPNTVLRESSSVGQLDAFYAIAEAWGQMVMHFLPENPVVLDIGCSCGKLARFLYMNPRLRYVGTDIFLPAIQWCRKAFAPLAAGRFQFDHFNAHSAVYNPQGTIKPSEYRFPYTEGAFNTVVCASLFTHLLQPDCVHYLMEISRVLGPRGRAIISIHNTPAEGTRFSGDEARIDVDQAYFVEMADQVGLKLLEVVGRVYGQQVLVFEK